MLKPVNALACRQLPTGVQELYDTNMQTNPIFKKFLTVAERENSTLGLPIMTKLNIAVASAPALPRRVCQHQFCMCR